MARIKFLGEVVNAKENISDKNESIQLNDTRLFFAKINNIHRAVDMRKWNTQIYTVTCYTNKDKSFFRKYFSITSHKYF